MKFTRRILFFALVIAMVLSMAVTGYCAEKETSTVTIVNSAENYVYEAYEIFAGDLFEGNLSNIVWGSGINEAGQEALLEFQEQHESAADLADALTDDNIDEFAAFVVGYLNAENVVTSSFVPATSEAPAYYKLENLSSGYYLIRNRSVASDGAYTNYILEVVGDSSLRHKASVPTVEKKVKDFNDSSNAFSDWQDSADYDKNDTVPFQLKAVLADNVSTYHWYKIEFQDTMDPGLTYVDNSARVYLSDDAGRRDITDSFEITPSDDGDIDLLISCNDVTAASVGATNNSVIVVEYDATLNDRAVIGAQGNKNEVVLAYSNNPYWVPDGYDAANPPATAPSNQPMGYTAKDQVVVFTYQVTVNKVDENNNPLPGATFDLYKKESNPEFNSEKEGSEAFVWVKKGSQEVAAVYSDADSSVIASYSTTFDRLDDGEYKICESVTPKGYNTCEDVLFTIEAEHDALSQEPELTILSSGTLATDLQSGALSTTIINRSGSVLPETGGIGTTIFYIVGGCLVLCAAVLLITKKRMGK